VTDCPHAERVDGVCTACGHCEHDVILNGACLRCGTTDLDPEQLSPKKSPGTTVVPVDRLKRR
jgi:hypothetical protein